MDARMDNGWKDGWMARQMDGGRNGWTDRWIDERSEGGMDGPMDG